MDTPDSISDLINSGIKALTYPEGTPELFAPIRYTLDSGGKRLRPSLLLSTFCALGGANAADAMPQALGIEMFHNFTLLHDDVMDNADIRRGRPTVHRKWSEDAAILSGDTMLTMATGLMCDCDCRHLRRILDLFNRTAMEVYQGQQLDMEFEKTRNVSVDRYMEMIRLKTSVLLACACGCGAILADASDDDFNRFYSYGVDLGLAFQLRDDWLDTFGDPMEFGKEIGGDILNEKKTWLLITALSEATDDMEGILQEDLEPQEKISQVKRVYRSLDLEKRCNELAERYVAEALENLAHIRMEQVWKEYFTSLAINAARRTH